MSSESVRKGLKPALFLVFLIVVVLSAPAFGVGERLGQLRDWIQGLGAWGPVVLCHSMS